MSTQQCLPYYNPTQRQTHTQTQTASEVVSQTHEHTALAVHVTHLLQAPSTHQSEIIQEKRNTQTHTQSKTGFTAFTANK